MIIEWLMGLGASIVQWFTSTFMVWSGPQPADVFAQIAPLVAQFGSVGVWLNWAALTSAVSLAIGVWLACLLVKAIRALIAHIPEFGGSG